MPSYLRERILVSIAETGNASRTAEVLGISQPTVSTTLKKIEQEVGGHVYHHGERPIVLTTLGEILCRQYAKIVSVAEQTDCYLRSYGKGILPLLRMGSVHSFSTDINPYFIPLLLEKTEKIVIRLAPSNEVSKMILENQLDLAIVNEDLRGTPDLAVTELLSEDFQLCLPARLAKIKSFREAGLLEKLSSLPFIEPCDTASDYQNVNGIINSLGIHPKKTMAVDCFSTMCQIVNRGEGWSLMTPLAMWIGRSFIENIVTLPLDTPNCSKHFFLCKRPWVSDSFEKYFLKLLSNTLFNEFLPLVSQMAPNLARQIHISKFLA